MKVAVIAETDADEPRVAATPETVKKMTGLGAQVAVEPGAGVKSGILDADYTAAGATVAADAVNGADIVLMVRRPDGATLSRLSKGAIVIAIMDPYGHDDALRAMADAGVISFRHGIDAAHHPRAVHGRAVEPGQPRRLPRGDRRRRGIRPRACR